MRVHSPAATLRLFRSLLSHHLPALHMCYLRGPGGIKVSLPREERRCGGLPRLVLGLVLTHREVSCTAPVPIPRPGPAPGAGVGV